MGNSVDPHQLATVEAVRSGPTMFVKKTTKTFKQTTKQTTFVVIRLHDFKNVLGLTYKREREVSGLILA